MAHLNDKGELVECGPVKTTDMEYAAALKKLMKEHTIEEIAERTGKSIDWIKSRLK